MKNSEVKRKYLTGNTRESHFFFYIFTLRARFRCYVSRISEDGGKGLTLLTFRIIVFDSLTITVTKRPSAVQGGDEQLGSDLVR
jgi:hypothetical protein